MMKSTIRIILALLLAVLTLAAPSLYAEDGLSYDRYAPVLKEKPESDSIFADAAVNFLTYPLELLRWPMSKSMVAFDQYYMLQKGQWLFEKSVDYGITPRLNGADFDLLRMTRLKQHAPDASLKGWVSFSPSNYFVAGGRAGFDRILESPFRAYTLLNYENRPEERFYGIGPDTSRGEGSNYRYEATTLRGELGYSNNPTWNVDGFAGYKRVNITNGSDGAAGVIDRVFPVGTIPGLDGDELFQTGIKLVRDTRNQKDNSNKGYFGKLGVAFNEGLYSSDARYMKYDAEFIKYLRLGSDRRVFVGRFYGEHNNAFNHRNVPFHQMFRLGGFGDRDVMGETLRAYNKDRFYDQSGMVFNFEYRYTVYEYRDWKMDAVVFWDEGQVFKNFGTFQFHDFRESYGGGFRVHLLNNTVIAIEMAHGDEGTNFYVKSRSPF